MKYTKQETDAWKIGLKIRGIKSNKRRSEHLPSPILIVNALTGERTEVKPVTYKPTVKKRKSKKKSK